MATREELLNQAVEIRDAEIEKENTALRVGTLLVDIVEYLSGVIDADDMGAILADYAQLAGDGLVNWHNSRCVFLASMGAELDNIDGGDWEYASHNGDIIFDPSSKSLRVVGESGNYYVSIGVVYINAHSGHAYKWDNVARVMTEITDSSRPTVITYRNPPLFGTIAIGESYYYEANGTKRLAIKTSANGSYSFTPDPKKIYVFKDIRESAVWDTANSTWLPIGGNINVVNNLTTGGADKALSAEMGKRLKEKVEDVQANIQRLYNNLGNIAFWNAAAKSAAAPIPLDWGGTKHLVTLNLSLTNAVVKHNGTAVANGATIQVEEYTALTLLVEASSGYTLQSVTSSTTGATVTDNGNGTYNVALTMGQSNVTLAITAMAAQAYSITYGTMTNCSVVTSPAPISILGGQSVEIEFSVGSGYELDSSCFTVANADKSWSSSTNKLTISNATGNVTISATASVPKLKFLKYYWMAWNNTNPYPSNSSVQGFYGKYAVSDYIPVPQMTITSSTKWMVFYKWEALDVNIRPLIMSYYKLENGQYTYLANKTATNTSASSREWTMSDANIISACAAGTLYVRLTLGMNKSDGTGTALHADGCATVGGTDIFRVGADNYRLVDEQDWDVDELNLS